MGIIERIKSALGLGTSPSSSQSAPSSTDSPSTGDGVDVTVEHEPATASEDAVKGTDTADDGGPTAEVDTSAEPDSPSVDGDSETSSATKDPDAATETDETDETDESATGTEADETDDSEPAPTEPAPDAELEDIKGIGPTYGERLREADIGGIGDLADADPAALAEETDIAQSRVEDWVEQAKLY
jgi:predicted flap endonuclease-1-like 5' DNA nuclease